MPLVLFVVVCHSFRHLTTETAPPLPLILKQHFTDFKMSDQLNSRFLDINDFLEEESLNEASFDLGATQLLNIPTQSLFQANRSSRYDQDIKTENAFADSL